MLKLLIRKLKSVTLVEIVISVLIVGIVTFITFQTLTQLYDIQRATEDFFCALDLATSESESITGRVLSGAYNFESLNTQSYPWQNVDVGGYPQGYFQRQVSITDDPNSSQFKRVVVAVRWNTPRGMQTLENVFYLSRAPNPLPGNVAGRVFNSVTNNPVGSDCTIYLGSSLNRPTDSNSNYTFLSTDGKFILQAGTYNISAQNSNYFPYQSQVVVHSGVETRHDIYLQPKPAKGCIEGRIVNTTNQGINGLNVCLYRGTSQLNSTSTHSGGKFTFCGVETLDQSNQSYRYTVATYKAFHKGYCGNFSQYPQNGSLYAPDGWSSAKSENSACDWKGGGSCDFITVEPGNTTNLGNITLIPIPLANIMGNITFNLDLEDQKGSIYIYWHDWEYYSINMFMGDSSSMRYSKVIPATADLFGSIHPGDNYKLRMSVSSSYPITTCCNESATGSFTQYYNIPHLPAGEMHQKDFNFNFSNLTTACGNLEGYVYNETSRSPIQGAKVSLVGYNPIVSGQPPNSNLTDSDGHYQFRCLKNTSFCAIPQGNYCIEVSQSSYLGTYKSCSKSWPYNNNYYNISITSNTTTHASPIYLWPKRYGTIRGRVLDSNTDSPIGGVRVYIDVYSNGWDWSIYTNSNGEFVFNNNILESWPPSDLPQDGRYQTWTRKHKIGLRKTNYNARDIYNINVTYNNITDLGDIYMAPLGGM